MDVLALMTPDGGRQLAAGGAVLAWLGLTGAIWAGRVRRKAGERRAAEALADGGRGGEAVTVAFASQTGLAESLAWMTARTLNAGGLGARVVSLSELTAEGLAGGRLLVVASTTGEGDAPDDAARFVRTVMGGEPDLSGLSYGLLALGDSSYARFCGFGRSLDGWLAARGARPLFDRVEVDDGDEGALRHWQHHLGLLTGATDVPDWTPAAYGRWRLAERRLLNAGGPGEEAYHLALEPLDGAADWRAGDIAEVGPEVPRAEAEALAEALDLAPDPDLIAALARRGALKDAAGLEALKGRPAETVLKALPVLPHREYSIASLPSDGRVELLVRRMRLPDGRDGLGSGWLTQTAPLGAEIALRIRANRSFHGPPVDRPMILIGNGTGLAGLRAHLKERAAAPGGPGRNWLLFGERTRAFDFHHRPEIEAWAADGTLERLDLAFSRDQAGKVYVQDRLAEAAEALRRWVLDGAAVYVCGSLEGMSGGVDKVLRNVLGEAAVQEMIETGRYRRDVY